MERIRKKTQSNMKIKVTGQTMIMLICFASVCNACDTLMFKNHKLSKNVKFHPFHEFPLGVYERDSSDDNKHYEMFYVFC